MAYTGNHRIDAALLVVINDGNGDQCKGDDGYDFNQALSRAVMHYDAETSKEG